MTDPHAHAPIHTEEHPEHHEGSDVPVRPLVWIAIFTFVGAVVVHLLLWWVFNVYLKAPEQAGSIHEVVPNIASDRNFEIKTPEPRIQGIPGGPGLRGGPSVEPYHPNTPRQDTVQMKAHVRQVLESSGESYDPGFRRIPIEDAMRLAVQRQLIKPHLPAATQPATQPKGAPDAAH